MASGGPVIAFDIPVGELINGTAVIVDAARCVLSAKLPVAVPIRPTVIARTIRGTGAGISCAGFCGRSPGVVISTDHTTDAIAGIGVFRDSLVASRGSAVIELAVVAKNRTHR